MQQQLLFSHDADDGDELVVFIERLKAAGLIVVREDWFNCDEAMTTAEIEQEIDR